MDNLKERVALVTGGSRGIGRAVCLELAGRGVQVFTCGRDEQALEETEALAGQSASATGSVEAAVCDVTDPQAVDQLGRYIEAGAGRLDILVNNAGVLGPRKYLEDISFQEWKETLEINIDGVFLTAKRSLELMRRADGALVINVSSGLGRRGRAKWGPYAVSKHGVEALTDTMADEWRDDRICVVSVNPGGTATRMRAYAYPDEDPATLPTADEVAETFGLVVDRIDLGQTGRKYRSRTLLDVEDDPDGDSLPHLGSS